jgi:hypothetical protein
VWDDGHKWCFGCGFYVPASKMSELMQLQNDYKRDKRKIAGVVNLPDDYTTNLPRSAVDWLGQYGLTKKEIVQNGIGYSVAGISLLSRSVPVAPLLILPVWGEGVVGTGVVGYQGRYMGEERGVPKYVTKGFPSNHLPTWVSDSGLGMVVVCEDIISSIKLGRVCPAIPLLGSFLSKENAVRLSRYYKTLTFWLDYDKSKEAVKQADQYRPFFDNVEIVITERDPKCYETSQLREFLHLDLVDVA